MTRAPGGARRVLISGGGIAGLTLAYWLHRFGAQPVVVEKFETIRREGFLLDFLGSGWDVAEWMGVLPELRDRKRDVDRLHYLDRDNRTIATLDFQALYRAIGADEKHLLLERADLEEVLYQAVHSDIEIRFGTTLQEVRGRADGVAVVFNDGREEEFDLLVGADGFHSQVRRLVFGEESRFAAFLGYHVLAFPVPAGVCPMEHRLQLFLEPGRQAVVYQAIDGQLLCYLLVRSPDEGAAPATERFTTMQRLFEGFGWKVPALLETITEQTPFFLDSVTQIRLPAWSRGPVVLIGDAAHCLTPISGQGASLAMAGAYVLAQELRGQGEPTTAFARYEARLRPAVERRQQQARWLAPNFVPRSRWGIWRHTLSVRLLWLTRLEPIRRQVRKRFDAASIFTAGDRPIVDEAHCALRHPQSCGEQGNHYAQSD